MNILKSIKEFLFPRKYNGFEITEMGKNIKIDYTPEVIDLVYNSTKLTEEEKGRTLNKILVAVITGRLFSESNYLYLKSKLTEKFETLENKND